MHKLLSNYLDGTKFAHDPNLSGALLVSIDPDSLTVPLLLTDMFSIPPQLQQPPQALPQASPQLGGLYNEPGMQLRYSDMHSSADNRQNVMPRTKLCRLAPLFIHLHILSKLFSASICIYFIFGWFFLDPASRPQHHEDGPHHPAVTTSP